jgi:uncharacterized membrane protein YeiB
MSWTSFAFPSSSSFLPATEPTSALDRTFQTFLTIAIELKAFALFSLLFGLGLAIQFERLANDPRRATLLVRRLAILLAIAALSIGICVYVAQVMISAQWLRYYRFGPVERLWRTLMYGVTQPFHR